MLRALRGMFAAQSVSPEAVSSIMDKVTLFLTSMSMCRHRMLLLSRAAECLT